VRFSTHLRCGVLQCVALRCIVLPHCLNLAIAKRLSVLSSETRFIKWLTCLHSSVAVALLRCVAGCCGVVAALRFVAHETLIVLLQ